MKNKYLTKYLCITLISGTVLSSPAAVMAGNEGVETVVDFGDGSGQGETAPTPTEAPATPAPTVAPVPTEALLHLRLQKHRSQLWRRNQREHRNPVQR